MSIFSKLFGKDKNTKAEHIDNSANEKEEKITIETSFATFYYIGPNPNENGYEAYFKWYEEGDNKNIDCYIDCNTPETTEASICLERLTKIYEDREWTDSKVKRVIAEHFSGSDGMITGYDDKVFSEEELINELAIRDISLYRNGVITYSVDHKYMLDIEDDEVHVVYDDKGNITFLSTEELIRQPFL